MNRYLFVIDYQNDFVDGALGFPGAEKLDEKIAAKIRSYGKGKVLFTRDTHFDNYMSTQEGRNLPVEHCIKDTEGWQICDELIGYADVVVDKITFGSVELPQILKDYGEEIEEIEEIELCGLCTDICVISNAFVLKASFPETKIVVDAKCCAGVSVESHETALSAMRAVQIEIVD